MNTNTLYQRRFFKNKWKLLMTMICSFALILASCSDNSTGPGQNGNGGEEEPPGDGEQENRLVSYSQDIQPIFNGNCTTSGCHDSSTKESGVDLSSYDAATSSVGNQYGEEIINPGEPDNSPIVDKIESDPEIGTRMPANGGALSSAEIDSIRAWIEDDAPDN